MQTTAKLKELDIIKTGNILLANRKSFKIFLDEIEIEFRLVPNRFGVSRFDSTYTDKNILIRSFFNKDWLYSPSFSFGTNETWYIGKLNQVKLYLDVLIEFRYSGKLVNFFYQISKEKEIEKYNLSLDNLGLTEIKPIGVARIK